MGRAGRGADEEELLGMGRLEQFLLPSGLVGVGDGRVLAKVDAGAHARQQQLGLEVAAHPQGVVGGCEGADDALERRQGREGVEWRDGGDLCADGGERLL